jgi:signal transduction histidine kinase
LTGTEIDIQAAQHSFVSEVFHNLSQPLTALQCSLELSLFRDQTLDELRASVETALQNAECLRQRLLLLRELDEANHPGDLSQPTDLIGLLGELQEELLPVCESAGLRFEVQSQCRAIKVYGNETKLMRGFYYLLEYLLRYSPKGSTLGLRLALREGRQVEISIAASSCLPVSSSAENQTGPQFPCEIEMARRSFRAAGGDFVLLCSETPQSAWKAMLPLAG